MASHEPSHYSLNMKRSYRKLLFVSTLILIGELLTFISEAQFITQWQVTSSNEVVTIPTTGPDYNYTVNWGDGGTSTATGDVSHAYTKQGVYKVSITGTCPRIYLMIPLRVKIKLLR